MGTHASSIDAQVTQRIAQRFSEDLDIVLDRDVLGFRGAQAPESAPSQTQRAQRLDALRVACQHYVRDALLPELDRALGGSPLDGDRGRRLSTAPAAVG